MFPVIIYFSSLCECKCWGFINDWSCKPCLEWGIFNRIYELIQVSRLEHLVDLVWIQFSSTYKEHSVHLALHGINHIHTSYSHHISLTFDLHNCISTKIVQNTIIPSHKWRDSEHLLWFTFTLWQKGLKNPKKRKGKKTIDIYHGKENIMGHHLGLKIPMTKL